MTTTLRPAAPEERGPGGSLSRAYDICVNGRRAGGVRLLAEPPAPHPGARAGRIADLAVEEADRRRGRAAVAALAAEEVLRGWGCDRVEATVPAGAGPALRLAAALGYTERNRMLVKELTGAPPAPPPGSVLRALTDAEFPGWLADDRARLVGALAAQGVPREDAERRADASYARSLPDGPATKDAALRVLEHDGAAVGTLWVTFASRLPGTDAFVLAVEVAAAHRGRGHGRTLMAEAERLCARAGGTRLGLSVFAGNEPALGLYRSLGYRPAEHHFYKPLR
jgi:ribosomal protein S18 acetylase RimI-like enzyme